MTGIGAGTNRAARLDAAHAAFGVTGPAVVPIASRKLTAGQGGFNFAGQSVELRVSTLIASAASGGFMADGIAANFIHARRIAAEASAIDVSGLPIGADIDTPAARNGHLNLGLSIGL
ncbi:MAG: hypothetical protein HC850_03915 [Rhodomicrobium sp.]|nr:hypothetical protein [Rhodomicrobium sp.]